MAYEEAQWAQNASYSPDEDRAVLASLATAGVVNGLKLTAGTGLSVAISPGRALVADSLAGLFSVVVVAAQSVTGLTPNSTSSVYLTVDPLTGLWSLVKGNAPTTPYLLLGSVTTNATTVTSVSMTGRTTSVNPSDAPTEKYGFAQVTTDASGRAVISHNLGQVPRWAIVIANSVTVHAHVIPELTTATQMTIEVRNYSANALITSTATSAYWQVKP